MGSDLRDTDRERDASGAPFADLGANRVGPHLRGGQRSARQHDHEFFTAQPARDIFGADQGLKAFADFAQDVIAEVVTVLVVEGLEEIDVEQKHRERRFLAHSAGEFTRRRLFEIASIEEAREGVADGEIAKTVAKADVAQRL